MIGKNNVDLEIFRRIIESAPHAILLMNREGRIHLVNAQAERLFGYTREELMGQRIEILVPERFRDKHPGHQAAFLARPTARPMGAGRDLCGLCKDGREVPMEIGLNPVDMEDGIHVLASIIDITERKRAEEGLRASESRYRLLNEQLEQRVEERTRQLTEANEELEAFSYSVSHDLRTPLRAIDGFSREILENDASRLSDASKSDLHRVRSAAQHMAQLIDDLLDLSRLSRSEMALKDLNLTEQADKIMQALQESDPDRQMEWILPPNLTARGDEHFMAIALDNLLSNAWKFTGKQPHARIEIGESSAGGKTVFYVRDNGVGFSMEYAAKLFGAFQRLHDAREFPGTGIGLALVQRIIHRHGGKIWAEAAENRGATFYFTLSADGKEEGRP